MDDPREIPRKLVQNLIDAAFNVRGMVTAKVENLTDEQIVRIHLIILRSLSIAHDSAFIRGYVQGFDAAIEKAAKFAAEHGCSEVDKIHKIPVGAQVVPPPIKYTY